VIPSANNKKDITSIGKLTIALYRGKREGTGVLLEGAFRGDVFFTTGAVGVSNTVIRPKWEFREDRGRSVREDDGRPGHNPDFAPSPRFLC